MAKQFHLADLFETVAATVPDRIAIRAASATLAYAELNDRADRLAAGLAAQGVKRGDTVGLYLMNSPAFLEGFIAAAKLGADGLNSSQSIHNSDHQTLGPYNWPGWIG